MILPTLTSLPTSRILAIALLVLVAACGGGPENNPRNEAGAGPAPVKAGSKTDLASSNSYVLLAKTGITNVTGSSVTGGAVGLSPAAASFITGFGLTADATNVFATSVAVPAGKIYASDYAAPTPGNLTSAVSSMETAYTDAAGRTTPDFLNLGSGNLGGKTLTAGLYTFGTSVTIPNDVTISGSATDVWIFQISNDLDLSAGKKILLSGGAQASNIFWQVAGHVMLQTTSHFEGVILSQTAVTMQTGASLHGRIHAQSLIALDNNTITAP